MRKIAFLFFFQFIFHSVSGQLSFDHITVANGLSQSTVLSILKDHRGYMWFGTRDRLNRYDAQHIKIYSYDFQDKTSISADDYIRSVYEDHNHNLWVGTLKGLNRYIPESDTFERILTNPSDPQSISSNAIFCAYEDSQRRMWFGGNTGLNMLISPTSRKFKRFLKSTQSSEGLTGNNVYAICEDHDHNLWVGTIEGLTRMTFKNGRYTFKSFTDNGIDENRLDGNFAKTIVVDKQGYIWVGTETGGLNRIDPRSLKISHFKHDPGNLNSLSHNDVRKILLDKTGKLWLGTMNGLDIFDPESGIFTRFYHDTENRKSLSDNSIKSLYWDNNRTLWIGTMYGGVNIVQPNTIPFNVYQNSKYKNSVSSNIISVIAADSKHDLWIGTEGKGLNLYNKNTGSFTSFINQPGKAGSIGTNNIKAIYKDRDHNTWIGLHQGGLDLFLPSSQTFKHFRHNALNKKSISDDIVSCILEDSQHRFWVGTSDGLDLFDRKRQEFRNYLTDSANRIKLSNTWVRCIYEDSKHNIWVGTTTGLNLLTYNARSFKWFLANQNNAGCLKADYINCVREDMDGNIWVGSFRGGLSLYNPQSQSFKTYRIKDGLPSDNVISIQQDDNKALWICTDNGLAKFNPYTKTFKNYTVKDGLPTNEFSFNSSFKDLNGDLYFGTYNGMVSFAPKEIKENNIVPPVVFTGLKLFNQAVAINDNSGLLKKDISVTREIVFSHNQNIFSLDFSALNYNAPDRNQYMYRLDGFEKDWNYVSVPSATYTNLEAGDYTFLLKANNSDGLWTKNTTVMHIRILPPFWKTWWAYLIYTLIFGGLFYLVIRFFRRQARLERDLYYEHLNSRQQQEVYQMKLDFFTKVSHEIRTPLTLILAPVEKLIELTETNALVSRQLVYVKQNADRLLRLVSELLDFRQVETGHMKLSVAEYNIVEFCKNVFLSFERLSISKNIRYHFTSANQNLPVYFDQAQFEKVLFNILSNAFKFTPEGGEIAVLVEESSEEHIEISITDNGVGIPREMQQHIFDNFYQGGQSTTNDGWGIGLALAKNIVELHQGVIMLRSDMAHDNSPGYTIFKVSLPKGKDHFSKDEVADEAGKDQEHLPVIDPMPMLNTTFLEKKEKHTVLLIEDNEDVRGFIKETLAGIYLIQESVNGQEGYELACKTIPDLIISDVMMPVMDGLELCHKIKTDDRTSHIPVILLTARVAHIQQINGLETGADVYITKPFSLKVLELNIRNLIQARLAMRKKYGQQIILAPKNKVIDSPDEKFLNRLMLIIENNMEDPEFDVPGLAKETGMSQTVLYRKLKALTDLTTTDFIKSVRLKQAAQILTQNKLSIAEVAYSVGFNDRKYFSKEFKKQFGKTPSEYMEQADHPTTD